MNNTRFAVSMHILTLLHNFAGELLSSEFIAGSVNVNPVIIRKELISLRKHGFVNSKEGKNGGFELAKPAHKITVADVFNSVRQISVLGKGINTPNPKCVVGKQINKHLDRLYESAEAALVVRLKRVTLQDFANGFK